MLFSRRVCYEEMKGFYFCREFGPSICIEFRKCFSVLSDSSGTMTGCDANRNGFLNRVAVIVIFPVGFLLTFFTSKVSLLVLKRPNVHFLPGIEEVTPKGDLKLIFGELVRGKVDFIYKE